MIFQLLMDNDTYFEINKCVFDVIDVHFHRFLVRGSGLHMDPEKSKTISNWPGPTKHKEMQQISGLWNIN